ncbi:MAG: histidine triad nucleotide-binding protein [Chlorobium sp.]|uniref:histidine triad nucleotide-binding protein n=1 Tax=Chlorobium sp. TaxID=1095 RepID=UPI0025B7EDA7|nr:histidine triad nucleotide-binding protein [Chlorobium sp.]MCF8215585.1 histidine triad nucleotide-binding protein [Chlorobium sp.]MCF8270361.1 histidine triad nucleotide-binding protein [Chlorobium sp.]MCF8286730.1 histidine triad nucleotide-binding protein [Chlorobium sp.]MCF8290252.1 histidine triad nucleotide-binding protein [Chlorobium sp.]MCF8384411.1 histidine triad nucleotide-binding protein [Chlorobium sp.]
MSTSFYNPECLFCRIVRGEIPATEVYRNEHVMAFRDITPVASQHVLIIPIRHIASLSDLQSEDLDIAGHILLAARKVAEITGVLDSGYRLVFNNGQDALQSVFHIHGHLIGGCKMGWPPFPGDAIIHG